MRLKNLFFALLALASAFQICSGQDDPDQYLFDDVRESSWINEAPKQDREKIRKLWEEIGASLKTTKNPYAGTYLVDSNSGYFLRWSPEKGFVFATYFDGRIVDYLSYGKVSVTDSEIAFNTEKEIVVVRHRKRSTPKFWIPAGQGKFLVKKNEIASFGNFYGGFGTFNGYPRIWDCDCPPFAVRQEKDFPQEAALVPPAYQKFIKKPINAQIITIGKRRVLNVDYFYLGNDKISSTSVTIDAGRKDGVRRDTMFYLIGEGAYYEQILKVIKVSDKTSQATVERSVDDNGNEVFIELSDKNPEAVYQPFPKLRPGIKITTSPFLVGLS